MLGDPNNQRALGTQSYAALPGGASERERDLSSLSAVELVGQVCLILPALVLPWFFGGVRAEAQVWLCGAVLVGVACSLVRILMRDSESVRIPKFFWPLCLALGWAAFQLLPLPGELHRWLGSGSYQLWTDLSLSPTTVESLVGLDAGLAVPAEHPTSLYPASTRRDLILLTVSAAIVFGASQLSGHSLPLVVTFGLIALNGAALAFFGIAQQLQWNGLLYGTVPLSQGGTPFASFVNRNNAAGYLNISLAAAIGLALYLFRVARLSESRTATRLGEPSYSVSHSIRRFLAGLDAKKLFALSAIALIVAGLLCSLSRGGWISAAIAAIGTLWFASSARSFRISAVLLLVATLAGFGLVEWLGRSEQVRQRFATFFDQGRAPDGRLAHWRDAAQSIPDFWLTGSGLGTYRFVYPLKKLSQPQDVLFYHAENQYLEALIESGVIGLGLLLSAVGFAGYGFRRLMTPGSDPLTYAAGVTGFFAVVSQAVHGFFDFGLYLPANMSLLALLCGIVGARWGLVQRAHSRPRSARKGERWFAALQRPVSRAFSAALATMLLWGVGIGYASTARAAATESAARLERLMSLPPQELASSDVTLAIRELSAAMTHEPGNAAHHAQLAELWILRARLSYWNTLSARDPNASPGNLWSLTTPLALHATLRRLEADGPAYDLDALRRADHVQTDLRNAARHLTRALAATPLLPKPNLLLAELAPLVEGNAEVDELFAHVALLAPSKPALLKESAAVQLQAGRLESGLANLCRVIAIAPSELEFSLRLAVDYVAPETVVKSLVSAISPSSPSLLVELAQRSFLGDRFSTLRYVLVESAREMATRESGLELGEREFVTGASFALEGSVEPAVEWLLKAVALRPEKTGWRFELASRLREQGRLGSAREHARICVGMEPQNVVFVAFLKQLDPVRDR